MPQILRIYCWKQSLQLLRVIMLLKRLQQILILSKLFCPFGMEAFTTYICLNDDFSELSILSDGSQKVSRQEVIDAPLVVADTISISVLDWMNRWMSLIIMLALLWASPHLLVCNSLCEVAIILVGCKLVDDTEQVDSWVVSCCLCLSKIVMCFLIFSMI